MDGKWYPPRWEYQCFTTRGVYDRLDGTLQEALQLASQLGDQGWEMINFSVQSQVSAGRDAYGRARMVNEAWSIVCFMKRPRIV